MRRLIAAVILFGGGVARAFWDNADGIGFWIDVTSGIVVAGLALTFLHYRWRAKEQRALTPSKVKDIFS